MNRKFLLIVALLIIFSCRKETQVNNTPPPPVPPPLVKDIVEMNLPSPYYHFEYDASGKVSFVSFAAEFFRYNVLYNAGKISEIRDSIIVNKDRLLYVYDNTGRVSAINYADSNGIVYTKVFLGYNGDKLVQLDREREFGGNFVHDKTLTMTYYPDGNLRDLNFHYLPFNGQPETNNTLHFEQYDNKINVESFGLLHNEFFDHLFLLPGVQLQKNNPGKETLTGDNTNYTVSYTYTYSDKNAPLTKKGDLVFLNGQLIGQHFETNATYSYY